jgi:hypothetical protein
MFIAHIFYHMTKYYIKYRSWNFRYSRSLFCSIAKKRSHQPPIPLGTTGYTHYDSTIFMKVTKYQKKKFLKKK